MLGFLKSTQPTETCIIDHVGFTFVNPTHRNLGDFPEKMYQCFKLQKAGRVYLNYSFNI
jgi:hypothetical protein